ncbi:uncharacterized protein LOC122280481 [Carya illinoinensis]|uniref:Uncharacterized protein n=1 Tax=Carya illinoinensis TaxID=32201 RepID=A0A922DS90_CARIL|nr:uncharacterized protein LOC122280481 [Carya illinoinensis]KAG6689400.1 hypothetical protein I3842_11G172900 [Carya illinoinensis]
MANDGNRKLKEHVTIPDRRDQISRILTSIGKFAVDSAINDSLKAVTGRKQMHKIVQEGFRHQPTSPALDDMKKPEDLKVVMQELQAKEDGVQEDTNKPKQGTRLSAKSVNGSSAVLKKKPKDSKKGSDLLETDKKRVFIRSRL